MSSLSKFPNLNKKVPYGLEGKYVFLLNLRWHPHPSSLNLGRSPLPCLKPELNCGGLPFLLSEDSSRSSSGITSRFIYRCGQGYSDHIVYY